jgi:hypothetical protein
MRVELKSWRCPLCKIEVVAVDDYALLLSVQYHFLEDHLRGVWELERVAFGSETEERKTEGCLG